MCRKLIDCETRYCACDREALAVVETVSRVWRVYLLEYSRFTVVIDHVTLTHLWKLPISDTLLDRQVHWVKRLMPLAQCMSILYREGSVNEADFVSHRPDFFHPDDVNLSHMRCSLSGGRVMYFICVIKTMILHCWYYQRTFSPLMITSWPN